MNAEIIAVGSELLLGQIVNSNAKFLSEQLAEIGVNVYYHTVVGDNPDRLKNAVKTAESRAQLIIFTGGLGPTKDDLTKETIAGHLNTSLEKDEEALKFIKDYFIRVQREMTPNNEKQAHVLKGSHVLKNEQGMAPGMFLIHESRQYMLLPGPPSEMIPMFKKYGRPQIEEALGRKETISSRVLRFFGIGEAELETEMMDLIDAQTNPTVAPLASDGEVTLRLTAKDVSKEKAENMLDEMETQILKRVRPYFYGYDDTTLMDEMSKELKKQELTIACAESLTGGLFQSQMTSISGAGSFLKGGIVCYSPEIKKELLDVSPNTISIHGTVSEPCAKELAENVREKFDSDIGISFTGAAGPGPHEGKDEGTIWIGISRRDRNTKTFLLNLAGTRNGNRARTVKYGSYFLLKELRGEGKS
ncbi:competence/damage-inducible protein A [Rossellomorea aquimaris]|uniref:Putative competence-damage inducible protein n=1 Tax=Rossellomorea aquimaris TaxID=189382 RepID=A0A5D4U5F0_9BACI|nr:competence/damage-inducible protein A [Rossellomorea aquimaris]TYS82400.1 competence/damage-inducible protein A [Rossellomorea aquimaris]